MGYGGNSGLGNLGGFGGPVLNTNTWNQPKMELSNQPISPSTKQNIPKLKGPDSTMNQLKIKKPETFQPQQQQNHYEMNLDPWASI